jgi:energy-coupling factor transporter ATP-binding protein EcfA2
MALEANGSDRERADRTRDDRTELVGLGDRLHHFPRQLSGGQEQRVAIARAIVTDPDFILADEPTGNLDAAAAGESLQLLSLLNSDYAKTIVMVTHDPHAAYFAENVRYLDKGVLRPSGQMPEDWIAAPAPLRPNPNFDARPGPEAEIERVHLCRCHQTPRSAAPAHDRVISRPRLAVCTIATTMQPNMRGSRLAHLKHKSVKSRQHGRL